MPEIELHGQRVSYHQYGEGPAIVLIHGITSSSRTWRNVIPGLAEFEIDGRTLPGQTDDDYYAARLFSDAVGGGCAAAGAGVNFSGLAILISHGCHNGTPVDEIRHSPLSALRRTPVGLIRLYRTIAFSNVAELQNCSCLSRISPSVCRNCSALDASELA